MLHADSDIVYSRDIVLWDVAMLMTEKYSFSSESALEEVSVHQLSRLRKVFFMIT